MTTAPNDAAVNAESAAKLVSDKMVYDAVKAYGAYELRYGEWQCVGVKAMRAALEAVAATLIERHATPQTQATHGECEAVALLELLQTKPRVSRFDGDAYDILWRGPVGKALVHLDSDTHDVSFSFKPNTHPAPSPTAAPALEPATDHICEYDGIASCRICAALSGVAAQLTEKQIGVIKKLVRTYVRDEGSDICWEVKGTIRNGVFNIEALDYSAAHGATTNSPEISSSLVVGAQGDGEARVIVRDLVEAIDRSAFCYEGSREDPEPILDRARAFLK